MFYLKYSFLLIKETPKGEESGVWLWVPKLPAFVRPRQWGVAVGGKGYISHKDKPTVGLLFIRFPQQLKKI